MSVPQANTLNKTIYLDVWRQLTAADNATLRLIEDLPRPTQSAIAERTGLSTRQVRRSATRLIDFGLIDAVKVGREVVYSAKESRTTLSPVSPVVVSSKDKQHLKTKNTTTDTVRKNRTKSPSLEKPAQLVLIEDPNAQNLGLLDIPTQLATDLDTLGINSNAIQPFRTAPAVAKKYSPAKILMFFDEEGAIAANLAAWATAYREGLLDLDYNGREMTPALLWVKVLEGQEPPLRVEAETMPQVLEPAPDSAPYPAVELPEEEAMPAAAESQPEALPIHQQLATASGEGEPPEAGGYSELDAIWREALVGLRGMVTKGAFDAHLKQARLTSIDGKTLTLQAPNEYAREWLEHRLKAIISRALGGVVGEAVGVAVVV